MLRFAAIFALFLSPFVSSQDCLKENLPHISGNVKAPFLPKDILADGRSYRFSCEAGYFPADENAMRLTCDKGIWTGSLGHCKAYKCPKAKLSRLFLEENKESVFEDDTPEEMAEHDSKAFVDCIKGYCKVKKDPRTNEYTVAEGQDYLKCHFGLWFGLRSYDCKTEEMECDPAALPKPENSILHFPTAVPTWVPHGEEISISCEQGYRLEDTGSFLKWQYKHHYAKCKCKAWKVRERKCVERNSYYWW